VSVSKILTALSSRPRRSASRAATPALRAEGLEGRDVLSFAISTAPSAAFGNPNAVELTLTGTADNESVAITDEGGGVVQVSQNGVTTSYANVDAVSADGKAGDDFIFFRGPTNSAANMKVFLFGGGGNKDTVWLDLHGSTAGGTYKVNLAGSAGDDTVMVDAAGLTVTGRVEITAFGGSHDDHLTVGLDGATVAAGATLGLAVSGGIGNDTVNLLSNGLRVAAGATLDARVFGEDNVKNGTGNDTIDVELTLVNDGDARLTVDGGAGDDTVTVYTHLATARDPLSLAWKPKYFGNGGSFQGTVRDGAGLDQMLFILEDDTLENGKVRKGDLYADAAFPPYAYAEGNVVIHTQAPSSPPVVRFDPSVVVAPHGVRLIP
jgi:hypothetical protein